MTAMMTMTPPRLRFILYVVAMMMVSTAVATNASTESLFRFAVLMDVKTSDDAIIATLNAADFNCDRITVSEVTSNNARIGNTNAEANSSGVRALLAASAVGIDECVVERAVSACAVLDDAATGPCGGFVVETSARPRDVRVHLISAVQQTASLPLISSEGATFFEKRNVVTGSTAAAAAERITLVLDAQRAQQKDIEASKEKTEDASSGSSTQDESELVKLLGDDDAELQEYMSQILEESEELERLRVELVTFASAQQQHRAQDEGTYTADIVSVDTDTIKSREDEMLKVLASKQEDVLEEALEKAGFFPKKKKKPVVVCKAGRLMGGGFERGSLILGTPPVYQPGFCKRPQVIPRRCTCTEPVVIPGFCVEGIVTPGKPNQYVPPTFTPQKYVPGTCSLFYKAIGHPSP